MEDFFDLYKNIIYDNICKSCKNPFERNLLRICGRCKSICYCSPSCQKFHWKIHKKKCVVINDEKRKKMKNEKNEKIRKNRISNTKLVSIVKMASKILDPTGIKIPVFTILSSEGKCYTRITLLEYFKTPINDIRLMNFKYKCRKNGKQQIITLSIFKYLMSEKDFLIGSGLNLPMFKGIIMKEKRILGYIWIDFFWPGKGSFMKKKKKLSTIIDQNLKGIFTVDLYIFPNFNNRDKNSLVNKYMPSRRNGIHHKTLEKWKIYPGLKKIISKMKDLLLFHLLLFGIEQETWVSHSVEITETEY